MRGFLSTIMRDPPGLAAGDGPAADGVDTVADLVRGGLRERRAAAGPAQLVVDDAMRLAGAMTPGADQAVEFLAQGGQGLAADGRCGGRGLRDGGASWGGWGGGGGVRGGDVDTAGAGG